MMNEGDRVTYYPPEPSGENLHFPAEIVGFTKFRVRVLVKTLSCPDGKRMTVSRRRLVYGQTELFDSGRAVA